MAALLWLALAQSVYIDAMGNCALPYRADYVGSKRCGVCHEDLIEQQKTDRMARTGRPATANDPFFRSRSPRAGGRDAQNAPS